MIFLSAQPDSLYFIWQVELQLFHLCQCGWAKENVHVLISYNPNRGPSLQAKSLVERFVGYQIYLYPDTRKDRRYASTVRPHIIEKHFESFPSLRKEAIFYIDSDVVFREIPDYSKLLDDEYWYASDTKSYMGSNVIINALGYDVFCEMCGIVKISPELVMEKEENTGGAQYIIKNIPAWFWPKVEEDSNNLYNYLYELLYANTDHNFFGKQAFDIWLTEMWVVCWNAILAEKPFVVHPMLDFCWANQTKEQWYEAYMLHYTGGGQGNFFRKTDFVLNTPFYTDLSYISDDCSSAQLRELVVSYRSYLDKERILMDDVTFVIPICTERLSSIDNLKYLLKYINANIVVLEVGETAKINLKALPNTVIYKHCISINAILGELKDLATLDIATDYWGIIPSDCIFPINQIVEAVNALRNNSAKIVCPFNNRLKVDVLTKHLFSKILDDTFLLYNIGKLSDLNKVLEIYPFFIESKELMDLSKEMQFEHDTNVFQIPGYLFAF